MNFVKGSDSVGLGLGIGHIPIYRKECGSQGCSQFVEIVWFVLSQSHAEIYKPVNIKRRFIVLYRLCFGTPMAGVYDEDVMQLPL